MSIFLRLREERERLGFSQEAFGVLGGVQKGERHPDSAYLAAIAAAGADVLYILTGQRTGGASAPAPVHALARDEEILLDNYRNCPPDARAAIKTTSAALARAAGGCKRDKAA